MKRPEAEDLRVPESTPSRAEYVVELLKSYRVGVYLALLSTVALLISGRWSLPTLPSWLTLSLRGFAIGIIPATILGKKVVVERYLPDNRLKVMVWDVPEQERQQAVEDGRAVTRLDVDGKRVPRGLWADRENPSEWPVWNPPGNVDAVVTRFEYDEESHELTVEGLNPEISNPADLAARDGRLAEVYGDLLSTVNDLARLEATIEAKTVEIERDNVNALLEAVEHGVSFETDALSTIKGQRWGDRDVTPDERDDPDEGGVEDDERPTLSDVIDSAEQARQPSPNGQAATDGGERR